MKFSRKVGALCLGLSGVFITLAAAHPPAEAGDWCRYPTPKPKPAAVVAAVALLGVGEVEPNGTPGSAQTIPFGDGVGQDRDLDITGSISTNSDVDYYRITALKGDVLGLAVHGNGAPDSVVAVTDLAGVVQTENDDHQGQADYYPATSPLPGGINVRDSVMSWIVPADGDYLIRVTSWNASSSGPYTLLIRGPRPYFEQLNPPATQIIFVDFNGATVNAQALFGLGNNPANLSPLSSFLAGWGFTAGDESAVIDAVLATINENFDDLRTALLNGDRDTDGINGHFDVEIRNSRDHADPFGQPNVSRLIIGGTISQLGISTIGIAQYIDPGNFGPESTGVVLLDLLSAPSPDPNSINSIPRDPSMTKIEAVGLIVGNIAAHEAGHYLGNWHTLNSNATRSIMDAGGNLPINMGGVGSDGTLGTSDDQDVDFSVDVYGGLQVGSERTNVRTAFALATGAGGCTIDADCDDGNVCDGSETCVAGVCQNGTPLNCDDGDACTNDSCNAISGCANTAITCNDGNACTADSCNPASGCVFTPTSPCCGTGGCESGENCTTCPADCISGTAAFCGNGVCEPGENCLTCAGDCRGVQSGNPGNRYCCSGGGGGGQNPVSCNDPRCTSGGFACSLVGDAYCCGNGLCTGAEDEANCAVDCACVVPADCDDGNVCTTDDCVAGVCFNDPVNCDDGNACTVDSCSGGVCLHDPLNCNDGNACTTDTCNTSTGCVYTPIPGCGCLGRNAVCTSDAQCCSGDCKANGRCR